MLTIFVKILVVFMMAGLGYIANKTGVLPEQSNIHLVNLLLVITTPCMILGSMAENTLNGETIITTIQVLAGSLLFFFAVCGVSYVIVRLLRYEPAEDRGVMMVIVCGVNTGFMGFPVTKALFGSEFLYYMVIENVVLGVYVYFLALIQMNYGAKGKMDIKRMLRSFCNMPMLACLVGMILLVFHIKLPSFLLEFLNTVGDATVPLSMIVVGVQLGTASLLNIMRNGKLMVVSLCNVILVPALTFLVVHWLPFLTWQTKVILVFAAAFPCAVVVSAMAMKEHKNATLAAEGIALTTLFSVVTLPLWAMFITKVYF